MEKRQNCRDILLINTWNLFPEQDEMRRKGKADIYRAMTCIRLCFT